MTREPIRRRLDAIAENILPPEYFAAERVAVAARLQAANLKPPAPPTADHPLHSGEITEDWINQTIEVETAKILLDKRRGVLLTLANSAAGRARSIHGAQRNNILKAFDNELQELLDDVRQVSEQLCDADTAHKAIANDAGPQWKRLTELADDYFDLRQAQQAQMPTDVVYAAKPQQPAEPHASDLYLRNLDQIWPHWRHPGQSNDRVINVNGAEQRYQPWPVDRTEQMLWLVRSDAKPWVPTEHQLEQLRQDRIARANPMPSNFIPGRLDKSTVSNTKG